MSKIKKYYKGINKWIIVAAFFVSILAGVGISNISAYSPKAWVAGYSTGQTSNLRSSQTLEVKTSGFAKEAYLEYTYTNNMQLKYFKNFWNKETAFGNAYLNIFKTNDSAALSDVRVISSDSENLSYTSTWRFFAMTWGETNVGTIDIVVKDTNPDSPTYNREVKTALYGSAWCDDSKNLNDGIAGMIKGETKELRYLTAKGGVPTTWLSAWGAWPKTNGHFIMTKELPETKVVSEETFSGTEHYDWKYHITPTQVGNFQVEMDYKRNALGDNYGNNHLLLRDDFGTPSGRFDVYVFDRNPTIVPTLRTLKVRDTTEGVTYSLGSESYTCTKDDQEIVFGAVEGGEGFLMIGKEYQIEMSKKVGGKTARLMYNATTNGSSHVTFNTNGVKPNTPISGRTLDYNSQNLSSFPAEADGYDFLGWNEKADGTGINYSTMIVNREYVTVYAQWKKKHYKADINIALDKQPYVGGNVGLYQDGKEVYRLKDNGNGHYVAEGIEYSRYGVNNRAYDIYVDGVDTQIGYILSGKEPDNTTITNSIYCYTGRVNLLNNGTSWKDQKVELNKAGTQYELLYDDAKGMYSRRFFYEVEKPVDEKYLVYINSNVVQKETTIVQHTITNDVAANELSLSYYDVSMEVKKDDVAWDNAEVTLRQNEAIKYTMKYDEKTSTYIVDGIVDFGQSYDVYIKGANTKEKTSIVFDPTNKTGTIDYYTVTFKDGSATHNTQVLLKGESARKPSNPYKEGGTFDYWNSKEDGTGTKYFQGGVNVTEPINTKTTIYASWQQPRLKIGTIFRTNRDGSTNGKGQFYRFPNLSITGYPSESGKVPIRTAKFTTDETSKIYVNNIPSTCTVQGNGTNMVTIYFNGGTTMAEAQKFLGTNVIIEPNPNIPHNIRVRVFGVTG